MSRIRTVKPEFFRSESIARLSWTARLSLIGLFTEADDKGRMKDNSAVLNGALWSMDDEHSVSLMESDLVEMATEEIICRFVAEDGKKYLHIPEFLTHQVIPKPSKSRVPECSRHERSAAPQSSPDGQLEIDSGDDEPHPDAQKSRGKSLFLVPVEGSETASVGPREGMDGTLPEHYGSPTVGLPEHYGSPTTDISPLVLGPIWGVGVRPPDSLPIPRPEGTKTLPHPEVTPSCPVLSSNGDTTVVLPEHYGSPTVVLPHGKGTRKGNREREREREKETSPTPTIALTPTPTTNVTGASHLRRLSKQPTTSISICPTKEHTPDGVTSVGQSPPQGIMATSSNEGETDGMGIYDGPPVDPFDVPPAPVRKRKIFSWTPEHEADGTRICDYLAARLLEIKPDHRWAVVTDAWREATELMLRKDQRDPSEIMALIEWVTQDAFWRSNIMSTVKLRDQYERLSTNSGYLRWKTHRDAEQNASPTAVSLCKALAEGLAAHKTKIHDAGSWRAAAVELLRDDHADPKEALAVIAFAVNSPFWRGKILSMNDVRRHYDRLRLDQENPSGAPGTVTVKSSRIVDRHSDDSAFYKSITGVVANP